VLCSCEAFKLSVGHVVEVPDGGEELDIGVGELEMGASFALVHGFELFFAVL